MIKLLKGNGPQGVSLHENTGQGGGKALTPLGDFESTFCLSGGDSGTVVEKSFSNQKVASSIPCRSVLEQDTEPLIVAISRTYVSRFG